MPVRPKHADTFKSMGFYGTLDEFRWTVAEAKADLFPQMTDEMLCFTRDEAGEYCAEVRRRLKAPRLSRVFILKALVGLRKRGEYAELRRRGREAATTA